MEYFSIDTPSLKASFKEAVIKGIAPDKGLYYPDYIPGLDPRFFDQIESLSPVEIGLEVMGPFTKDILSKSDLKKVLETVLDFDFPIVPLTDSI